MRFFLLSCLLVLTFCYYTARVHASAVERRPTSSVLDTFDLINEAVTDAELDTTNMLTADEHHQHQLMKQKSLLQMHKPAAGKKKKSGKPKNSVTNLIKKLKAKKEEKKRRIKDEMKKLIAGVGRGGKCLKNKEALTSDKFPNHKKLNGYSEEVAFQLKKYSDIAYCPYQSIKSWSCTSCKDEALTGFKILGQPFGAKSELSSFVGLAPLGDEKNAIVIAFRGTNMKSIKNWSVNLAFAKKSAKSMKAAGKVHGGFLKGYGQMEAEVLKALKLADAQCPDCKVYITGHSLGGALATIAAAKLVGTGRLEASRVVIYTFGSPRIGDSTFAAWFARKIPNSFRVTHGHDIVPTVPPAGFGFKHISREVYYPHVKTDFLICDDGTEDKQCHKQNGKLKNIIKGKEFLVLDHMLYVGDPVLCNQLPPAKSFLEMDRSAVLAAAQAEQIEMQQAALELYRVLGGTMED